jgi:uncharacterized integral membrane protein
MRYLRYLLLSLIVVGLVSISLANRELVGLAFLPPVMAESLEIKIQAEVPLFIVIFLSVFVGLFIGFFWEWLRTTKQRLSLRSCRREVVRLSKEINRQKPLNNKDQADVLKFIEEVS